MDTQPEREQAVKRAQRTGIKLFWRCRFFLGRYTILQIPFSSNIVTIFFLLFAGGSRRKCQHESGGKHFYLLFERSRKLSACHFHAFIRSADRPNGQKEKYIGLFTMICVSCTILMGVLPGLRFRRTYTGFRYPWSLSSSCLWPQSFSIIQAWCSMIRFWLTWGQKKKSRSYQVSELQSGISAL